jgi:hypothetical protein
MGRIDHHQSRAGRRIEAPGARRLAAMERGPGANAGQLHVGAGGAQGLGRAVVAPEMDIGAGDRQYLPADGGEGPGIERRQALESPACTQMAGRQAESDPRRLDEQRRRAAHRIDHGSAAVPPRG